MSGMRAPRDATAEMDLILEALEFREARLVRQWDLVDDLASEKQVRHSQIESHTSELYGQSQVARDEQYVFAQSVATKEADILQRIGDAHKMYDRHVGNLEDLERRKGALQLEVDQLREKIGAAETEHTNLDERSVTVQETLFEYCTKPFSRFEISEELQKDFDTELAAARAILELHVRLIHDLRQRICDEKTKQKIMRSEFKKQVLSVEDVAVDDSDKRAKMRGLERLKHRVERLDVEMREMEVQKPRLEVQVFEKKEMIAKIKKDAFDFQNKMIDVRAEISPGYNAALQEEIGEIRSVLGTLHERCERRHKRLDSMKEIEVFMKQKIRKFESDNIEAERRGLELEEAINKSRRMEIEVTRHAYEEILSERFLVEQLSEIQRKMAVLGAEFGQIVENEVAIGDEELRIKECKVVETDVMRVLARRIDETKRKSLGALVSVRTLREHNDFVRSEVRAIQGKLHLEQYNIETMRLKNGEPQPMTGNRVAVVLLKERIEGLRESNSAKQKRIDSMRETLAKVEGVHGVGSNVSPFVLDDSDKVIDRLDLRGRRLAESATRVGQMQTILNSFSEFHHVIKSESSRWHISWIDGGKLSEWISQLAVTCRCFRDCGV